MQLSNDNLALDIENTQAFVQEVVINITKKLAELTIDIPNIVLIPSHEVTAAVEWYCHAAHYAVTHDGKPWYYVLIPHDVIKANHSFEGLCAEFTIS